MPDHSRTPNQSPERRKREPPGMGQNDNLDKVIGKAGKGGQASLKLISAPLHIWSSCMGLANMTPQTYLNRSTCNTKDQKDKGASPQKECQKARVIIASHAAIQTMRHTLLPHMHQEQHRTQPVFTTSHLPRHKIIPYKTGCSDKSERKRCAQVGVSYDKTRYQTTSKPYLILKRLTVACWTI